MTKIIENFPKIHHNPFYNYTDWHQYFHIPHILSSALFRGIYYYVAIAVM